MLQHISSIFCYPFEDTTHLRAQAWAGPQCQAQGAGPEPCPWACNPTGAAQSGRARHTVSQLCSHGNAQASQHNKGHKKQ